MQLNQTKHVKALLTSDSTLFAEIRRYLEEGRNKIKWTLGAIQVLQLISGQMSNAQDLSWSTLYNEALSGRLQASTTIRETLLFLKKAPSNIVSNILPVISDLLMGMPPTTQDISPDNFRDLQEQLESLLEESTPTDGILRSEHDVKHETFRTTVVAQKVALSKQKAKLSKSDTAYSKIVVDFHDLLESYFQLAITPARAMFLHEILFYDLKLPHREAFDPRPRFAIERALSSPHDYLGCSCCQSAGVCQR